MDGTNRPSAGAALLAAVVALASACGAPAGKAPEAASETAANVTITHLPSPFWTVVEGAFAEQSATPDDGHAQTQNLTWLVHLVLASREREPLRIERVEVTFSTGGQPQWSEVFSEPYLRRLEWIKGAFDMTPDYYLDKVLHGSEEAGGPEIPAGGTLSWVRIPFGRPWFARAEAVAFRFQFKDPAGRTSVATHTVPIAEYRQKTRLRLPFSGVWAVNVGNDLSTGHRRSGLNGLTSYGWDFVKLGPDAMPYRKNGGSPEDYYTHGQPVLSAADGTVVDVRNDIPPFGIGKAPSADALRKDGDLFSGNLVTVDHGNGEFSFICHMLAGSVLVKVGDRVKAGQTIGRVGNSGFSGVPHIHFNLITGPKWLQARGLPALFSDVERIRTGGLPVRMPLANPVSAWLVRQATEAPATSAGTTTP